MTDHTASTPPESAPPRRRRYWRTLAGALLGLMLACAGIGAWTIHRIWTQLPSVEHLAVYRPALPLRIFPATATCSPNTASSAASSCRSNGFRR